MNLLLELDVLYRRALFHISEQDVEIDTVNVIGSLVISQTFWKVFIYYDVYQLYSQKNLTPAKI